MTVIEAGCNAYLNIKHYVGYPQRGSVNVDDRDSVRCLRGVPAAVGADHRGCSADPCARHHHLHLVPHRRRRHDTAHFLQLTEGIPVSTNYQVPRFDTFDMVTTSLPADT